MATQVKTPLKGATALWVSTDTSLTEAEYDAFFVGSDSTAGNFDYTTNSASIRAIAVASSIGEDLSGETEEIVDLSQTNPEYADPFVISKSGSFSLSATMLRDKVDGEVSYDDTLFQEAPALKIGDTVMVIKADYPLVATGTIDLICRAVVTSRSKSVQGKSAGTVDLTLQSKGAWRENVTIA